MADTVIVEDFDGTEREVSVSNRFKDNLKDLGILITVAAGAAFYIYEINTAEQARNARLAEERAAKRAAKTEMVQENKADSYDAAAKKNTVVVNSFKAPSAQ